MVDGTHKAGAYPELNVSRPSLAALSLAAFVDACRAMRSYAIRLPDGQVNRMSVDARMLLVEQRRKVHATYLHRLQRAVRAERAA